MPSEVMDQRGLSPSSYFFEEIRFPAERKVGFWTSENMPDSHGVGMGAISRTSGSKSIASSPLEKLMPMGTHSMQCLELPASYPVRDQNAKLNLEHQVVMTDKTANSSMTLWRSVDQDVAAKSNLFVQPASYFMEGGRIEKNSVLCENGLFSSSFSEIFSRKLKLSSNDVLFGKSVDTVASQYEEQEPFESLDEIEAQTIGNLLPDDDDLLSGVIDELEYIALPNSGDDTEDFDLFSSGGGMELEGDDSSCGVQISGISGDISNGQQGVSYGSVAGEHPYGEHPSRTLFVRNINSHVEDTELKALFEQYGDIRTLYTACKHRGFVMISYYDIRAARNAMRALQNKPLRRRKLDIHYSIPKDNPSEKDINQGTLVVFNLDSSVSNDDLRQIFGVYGEIKEIRETPHKRHHKFIEFYDVRAADAALRALNRSDIAGKRIKLEPSRPGGARRLMQQLSPELEQEDSFSSRPHGSPPNNSPAECFVSQGSTTSVGMEHGAIQGLHSKIQVPIGPLAENTFYHGISSSVPNNISSPVRIASFGNQSALGEHSHSLGQMKFGFQSLTSFHPHSLPEHHDGLVNGVPYHSPGTMAAMAANMSPRPSEGIDNRCIHRIGSNRHPLDVNDGVFSSSRNGSCPLHGHQYVWSNSNSYHPRPPVPMMWSNSPSFVNGPHNHAAPQLNGLPRMPSHLLNPVLPVHHHVGSAPAVNPSLWDRRHAYLGESPERSNFPPGSLGSTGFPGSSTLHPVELSSRNIFHVGGNHMDPSIPSTNVGLHSPQQRCHMFPGRSPTIPMASSFDAPNERLRGRRSDTVSNQTENKKQYELDIDRILRGEDTRTTLMIKNIPNKYTSKMLLATIDEQHRGTYDFIYLPIDFKNKCNVGYAFINLIDPLQIVPFYKAFNGKKWEKFNSEKVASLAYARIQGKAALVAHFQNSSLMNEDKRCRPILFRTDGPNAGDQEPFPVGANIRSRPGKSRTSGNEDNQGSPPNSTNGDESSSGLDSTSGSTKDSD
ncbi:PREDICTED: protein MEI2-like 4 isoform X2 [Nelumbo nucifera]|uniref:Protein MEI2-like 4 isoform X2 n=1 Tax=Nelumbo nucifera TaxID=4432 RepID=A0A1U7ZCQ1_NELNU|nr:PREDICTED: protein MEI2-like 4 isoform X2 [Nelumbo nucifera]